MPYKNPEEQKAYFKEYDKARKETPERKEYRRLWRRVKRAEYKRDGRCLTCGAERETSWSCRACADRIRNCMYRKKYGITLQQVTALKMSGCAICGETAGEMHLDHDHSCCPGGVSCGRCIRGVICEKHNLALGLFRDDVEDLLRAVAYLTGHRTKKAA